MAAIGAATLLSGCDFSLSEGIANPCRARLPAALAEHPLVLAAWRGLRIDQVWDCHAHLFGTGDSRAGLWVNPQMQSLLSPLQLVQRLFYLNASCAHDAPGRVDESVVERLLNLVDGLRPGVKLLLFAFDWAHDERGRHLPERSTFHVPDAYARQVAQGHPGEFEWVASIHPYRADAVEALEQAAAGGARAVKWLPPAQNIDPANPRCDAFYAALTRLELPLITHAGEEKAVHGSDAQILGNPLKLRRALDAGVRVVVAHCASLGHGADLDAGASAPARENFELFLRLFGEARHEGRLFGDLSALPQLNRLRVLPRLLAHPEWHGRLLNGSDYPLPGVMPIFSVDRLVEERLLEAAAAPVLKALRAHNPLLFDLVLKRSLAWEGERFAARVFETRPFFDPGSRSKESLNPGA
ncbi:MAG: amidohydrolase [Betaproteobacteria bacterium]|nr:amidohydrolase [Betaproteobacteria bacterium]